MTIDNSVDALLQGGGSALKFPTIGTSHRGTVISATTRQAIDFVTKAPKTFKDGSPIMELVVTLQTDQRDDDQDDGVRRLFCNRRMLDAIRTALKGRKLEAGGELAIQYHADGKPEAAGLTPPKLFQAAYRPPAPVAPTADALLATPAPAAQLPRDFPDPTPPAPAFDPFLDA